MDIFAIYKPDITQVMGYKELCGDTLFARECRKNLVVTQIICGDSPCILLPQ